MSAVMSDQQSSNNVAEFFSPGPGERLRAARLSMGFDLAKIAGELHLTQAVVELLEADDYSDIGARVFVRGYLRNYARIVEMPVESILRQFDEKWPDDTARQSMVRESPTLPADGGPSRGLAGAMTWLMVIGLLVLFLMWWRGYLDEIVPEQIRSGLIGSGITSTQDIQPQNNETLFDGGLDGVLPDGSLRLPTTGGEIGMPVQMPQGPDMAMDEATDAATDAPATGTTEADSAVAPAEAVSRGASTDGTSLGIPAAESSSQPTTQSGSPEPVAGGAMADGGAPVVEGAQQVVMTFSSPCWVDVRDSERKFKLFGEMPKGSRKVLGGKPPYKLVIGNAQAVSISINGKPFDLAPYAKGNVARFTLNP